MLRRLGLGRAAGDEHIDCGGLQPYRPVYRLRGEPPKGLPEWISAWWEGLGG